MKSIKSFLIVVTAAVVLFVGGLSTVIAYCFARSTAMDIIYDNLESLADSVSSYVASEIDKEMAVLRSLSVSNTITSTTATLEEKAQYLEYTRALDSTRATYTVIDTDGNGASTDGQLLRLGDRDYFRQAM